MSNYPIITISREYYAGGRSVAKRISEAINIPWYDHDFVKLVSKISGYSEDEIKDEGESISKIESAVDSLLSGSSFYKSSHDEIYSAQKDAVLELAKSPCIIVGRGANVILQEAGIKSFDIFLFADEATRIERVIDNLKLEREAAKKYLTKRDALRKTYYEKYYEKKSHGAHDYTICLDTGVIDYDTCANTVVQILGGLK